MNRTRPPATPRVWTLLHEGEVVGSYTDHSGRTFAVGDMLRDDRDDRRQVLSVQEDGTPSIGVSKPDVMDIDGAQERPAPLG